MRVLDGSYSVYRLGEGQPLPAPPADGSLYSLTVTGGEISLVCRPGMAPNAEREEPGWAALAVEGTLDFSLVGILAGISGLLAEAGVSIFAISTFDTDYVLVKRAALECAAEALSRGGVRIS